jgi:hypothetical protein
VNVRTYFPLTLDDRLRRDRRRRYGLQDSDAVHPLIELLECETEADAKLILHRAPCQQAHMMRQRPARQAAATRAREAKE